MTNMVLASSEFSYLNYSTGKTEPYNPRLIICWYFIFGSIFFVKRKIWKHAWISVFLILPTHGISWLVYPWFSPLIERKRFERRGYILTRTGVPLELGGASPVLFIVLSNELAGLLHWGLSFIRGKNVQKNEYKELTKIKEIFSHLLMYRMEYGLLLFISLMVAKLILYYVCSALYKINIFIIESLFM